MKLSVIIVSFNTKNLLKDCLESVIANTKNLRYEIIVIDNNSNDSSKEYLKKLSNKNKKIKLVFNSENIGFGVANNQGIKKSEGEYLLFLNSDTVVKDNLLKEMVGWMDKNSKVGIASCMLKNTDGTIQATGGYFPTLPKVFTWMTFIDDIPVIDLAIKPFHPMHVQSPFHKGGSEYKTQRELDWVTGAFFLIRKKVVGQIGGFDEDYFMYTEETDLCFRAKRAGWKVMYLPKWSIEHAGGASSQAELPIISEYKGIKLFYRKHMPSWQFPILRLLLKVGALLRIVVFGVLKGSGSVKTYAKAFQTA
jgi:GT2 family glycosyltransferase